MRVRKQTMIGKQPSALRHAVRGAALSVFLCGAALGQDTADTAVRSLPPVGRTIGLSGPRFGATFLSDGIVRKLDHNSIRVGSAVTQFGWQFEKQFLNNESGPTAVTEWVFLVGGMEQGVMLPSLSWLVGLRTKGGVEFGVGPNITPAGTALAFAGGVTLRAGSLNLPLNLAVVPSKSGVRVSLLCGFTMRKR